MFIQVNLIMACNDTSKQLRTERSFELNILLKNFRMKQKKIDKDQRILLLTAIAIDNKLWGF